MIERTDLAIRLSEEIGRSGLTRGEICRRANISTESLRRYENGQSGMPAEFVAAIATNCGVDALYLLTGTRSAQTSDPPLPHDTPPAHVSVQQGNIGSRNTGNVIGFVASGAKVINTQRHVERVVADVKPGDEHINDEQAAALKVLVEKVVKTESALKQKPRSFQSVWGALNAHCKVPQYRLIKVTDFQKAQNYLHQWIGRLDSMASAPVKDGDAWRKRKYSYIKINSKDDPAIVDNYIARNFKASSLTELDNQQLEQTYRYVAGRKARK
jgi:hypothetical protein